MNYIRVIILTFLQAFYLSSISSDYQPRIRRQQDHWVWTDDNNIGGNVVNVTTTPAVTTADPTTANPKADDNNPCSPYNPSQPNFFTPGRRISETKCLEYIWKLKNRDDKEKRKLQCSISKNEKRKIPGNPFTIGGRSTVIGEFPHMGALGWKAVVGTWIFHCGSTLISEKYLLTAAHCSETSEADTTVVKREPEIVRLGSKNIAVVDFDDFPEDVKIKPIIKHPNYVSPKRYFDIALVEMEKSIEFYKYIQPACLWHNFDEKNEINKEATITGWGVVDTAKRTKSPELQAALLDIIDPNLCDRLLHQYFNRNWDGLESHQMCAGKLAGGVDACAGDSGGPLQVEIALPIKSQGLMHRIIGVTSFGIGCGMINVPGVYTRVSSFIDWIENIVWLEPNL